MSRRPTRTRRQAVMRQAAMVAGLKAGKKQLKKGSRASKLYKKCTKCQVDQNAVCRPKKYQTKKRKRAHRKQLEASKNLLDIEKALK